MRIYTTHPSTTMTISASLDPLPSPNLSLKISDSQKARAQIRILQPAEVDIQVELAEAVSLTLVLDAEVMRLARKNITNSRMTRILVLGLVVAKVHSGVEGLVLVGVNSETVSAAKVDSSVEGLVLVGTDSEAVLAVENQGSGVDTLTNMGTRLALDEEALGVVGDMARKGMDVVDTDAVGSAGRNMDVGVGVQGMGETRMEKVMERKGTAVLHMAFVLLKVRPFLPFPPYSKSFAEQFVSPSTAHPYAHLPELASVHDEYTDPELFHQAAERLHYTQQQQQQQPQKPQPPADFPPSKEQVKAEPAAPVGGGGKYDTFESHFANHAQAYGCVFLSTQLPISSHIESILCRYVYTDPLLLFSPDADHTAPMDTDAIGSAAAVEALKMSAAQNQAQSHPPAPHAPSQPQSPPAPSKPAAPQSHPVSSKPAANPSASPAPHKPQPSRPPPPKQDDDDEEEEEKSGGGGGGSAQDKIVRTQFVSFCLIPER